MKSKNIELNEDQQLAILEEWNKRTDDPPYIKAVSYTHLRDNDT